LQAPGRKRPGVFFGDLAAKELTASAAQPAEPAGVKVGMRSVAVLIPLAVLLLVLGCAPREDLPASTDPKLINLQATSAGFSVRGFDVAAGESIIIELTNGDLGRGCNFVILQPGTPAVPFARAGEANPESGYISTAEHQLVYAASGIARIGQTLRFEFIAPSAQGDYPYLSTVPGQAASGLVGVMTVR
jgi:hypothetical protein